MRIYYLIVLKSVFNFTLKGIFSSPRPFHLDPTIGIIEVGGYGFPSGAAQTVILLSGILLVSWNSSWKWLLACTYILFISFSRIYLGVHFPTDILAGWCVGLALFAAYYYLCPPVEKMLEQLNPLTLFMLSQAIPVLMMLHYRSFVTIFSMAMGMGIGVFIVHLLDLHQLPSKTMKENFLKALIGVLGTFAFALLPSYFFVLNSAVSHFFQFLIVGIWISFGSQIICRTLFQRNHITAL